MSAFELSPYLLSKQKRRLDRYFTNGVTTVAGPVEWLAKMYLRSVLDEGDDYFIQARDSSEIVKLRTMNNPTHADDGADNWTDQRYGHRVPTQGARLIRLLRIDELPQLRQVKEGSWSVVSPRPTNEEFNQLCLDAVGPTMFQAWQIFCKQPPIKPGLTSPAQVANLRAESIGADYCARQVELDIKYCLTADLQTDLKVILDSAIGVSRLAASHLVS